MKRRHASASGDPTTNGPAPHVDRRDFLKATSLALSSLALSPMPVMAGPFSTEEWNSHVPADKKLRPEWVKSLFARGEPTVYRKSRNELAFIGMPVGGLCCGTLYLGGDGRLWCWDIFNQNLGGILPREVPWSDVGMNFAGSDKKADAKIRPSDGAGYVKPHTRAESPDIAQGFVLQVSAGAKQWTLPLDAEHWAEVTFTGQYPIGTVEYTDPACPVAVRLEAFSPFMPLNGDDSSLPATIFSFRLTNQGGAPAEVTLAGFLQNASCFHSAKPGMGKRVNRLKLMDDAALLAMGFEPASATATKRPDLAVEDFERGYEFWKVEGAAFGHKPANRPNVPAYQGDLGGEGSGVANSHATAPGEGVEAKDNQVGRLTSKPFKLERRYLSFYIGGGSNAEKVGLRVLIDGKVVATAAGRNENHMRRESLDLAKFEGRDAVIEIYDDAQGGWGNIGVDQIVQTDQPKDELPLEKKGDFGTMCLALVGRKAVAKAALAGPPWATGVTTSPAAEVAERSVPEPLVGSLARSVKLRPGESGTVEFVLAWHFPNNTLDVPDAAKGNYYAGRFPNAEAVAGYVSRNLNRLGGATRLWRDTWADATLPHWFLERTMANTTTLATTTSHRFATGRFWGWEGIGCCNGTCTHVWHYAQAVGRLFPEIERDLRERVDFGVGFDAEKGMIRHRGEGSGPAIDGQCGRILGVYREHLMSADAAFLKRLWPRVKQAAQYVLSHDRDGDGILDGAQENTLDAAWYGQIAWISSLAVAALRATEVMAREMGDEDFATVCRARADKGTAALETKLYNGEYFIQLPEPGRETNLGTYQGCHIDQVHGQSWAWQVGLGRILDRQKTISALQALWKYNFSPDVGPFRQKHPEGRPYALAGDAGLIMSTNPQLLPNAFGAPGWQSGYFNECMSGFEHQAASHMIAEGMVLEGLAVTRVIHDRYHATRRNPWNEIECSDHYARAMASYGSFVSACGFDYHGPQGRLAFAPRLSPEDFRAPFVTAEGWGTFSQKAANNMMQASVRLRWGRLRLTSLVLTPQQGFAPKSVRVTVNGRPFGAALAAEAGRSALSFVTGLALREGDLLEASLT